MLPRSSGRKHSRICHRVGNEREPTGSDFACAAVRAHLSSRDLVRTDLGQLVAEIDRDVLSAAARARGVPALPLIILVGRASGRSVAAAFVGETRRRWDNRRRDPPSPPPCDGGADRCVPPLAPLRRAPRELQRLAAGGELDRLEPGRALAILRWSVDLGTGRRAVQVSAGIYHTCAVLDDGKLKCWGISAKPRPSLKRTPA